MYIISSFEYSAFLELAITELEEKGISKRQILAVPLKKPPEERKIFDTIHRSDGISLFDGAAALGAACMALGTIYGFVLKPGPIITGLIGLLAGVTLGFLLDLLINRKNRGKKAGNTEVVLMVRCDEIQAEMVEKTLSGHFALGMARLP